MKCLAKCLHGIVMTAVLSFIEFGSATTVSAGAVPVSEISNGTSLNGYHAVIAGIGAARKQQRETDIAPSPIRLAGPKGSGAYCSP